MSVEPESNRAERRSVSLNVIQENASYDDSELKPVIEYLEKNWRSFLVTIVAAVAVFYSVRVYRETNEASVKAAADRYARVRATYQEYLTAIGEGAIPAQEESARKAQQEKIEQVRARFDQDVQILSTSKEPYIAISILYRHLGVALSGDEGKMKEAIRALDPEKVLASDSTDRMYQELSLLALGRGLLDHDGSLGEAKGLLRSLVQRGTYTSVGAATTLAKIASTPEERGEARSLIEALSGAHPEHAEALQDELARLS